MHKTRALYHQLSTEQSNPATRNIDRNPLPKVIDLILQQDRRIPQAVSEIKRSLTKAVGLIVESLREGGTLFFVGAGTSGRLGVMEAAECPPTFNTPPEMVQAIMAGGRKAVFHSQEGAEDNSWKAEREISRRVRKGDVVVGIAASGITPFVQSALAQAHRLKAKTILVTCNANFGRHSEGAKRPKNLSITTRFFAGAQNDGFNADVVIAVNPGPEVISGSTRMKAGTCTKMILNTLTTASMIRLGKVYGHWMVDLQPKSKKLRARALRLVTQLGKVNPRQASRLLHAAHGHAKTAILMARTGSNFEEATRRLRRANGFLRQALER